jgi:hypothetical protein
MVLHQNALMTQAGQWFERTLDDRWVVLNILPLFLTFFSVFSLCLLFLHFWDFVFTSGIRLSNRLFPVSVSFAL